MATLPANHISSAPGIPVSFVDQPVPMTQHHSNTATLKHWDLKLTQQMIDANERLLKADQELRSAHEKISELEYRLVAQNGHQHRPVQKSNTGRSLQSYGAIPRYDRSWKQLSARPYGPALIAPSPTQSTSTASSSESPVIPITPAPPSTPNAYQGKRHHRTATPKQRQIRSMMQAPVFTLGIDPQTDRGLLTDFFEAIKTWAATYTIHLRTLSAEQIHDLSAHGAIAGNFGPPSGLMTLVTEKDMLINMVAALTSRYVFVRTIDEHSLYLSGHPNAQITEQLAYEWTQVHPSAHEQRNNLLQRQRQIYTAIKAQNSHKAWRTTCAEIFTNALMKSLDGLLIPNLPPFAIQHRNHLIQELFVKGYRIGFRMRMAAVRWEATWPLQGAMFDGKIMVNESRMLYGDVLTTMREVAANEGEHVVRFAISPAIRKMGWSVGGGEVEVVHSGLVLVTRRVWLCGMNG